MSNRTLKVTILIRGCRNLCQPKAAPCPTRQMAGRESVRQRSDLKSRQKSKCEPSGNNVAPKLMKGNAHGSGLIMKAERRGTKGCRSRSGTKREVALAPRRSGVSNISISQRFVGQRFRRQNRIMPGVCRGWKGSFFRPCPLRWARARRKRREVFAAGLPGPTLGTRSDPGYNSPPTSFT